MKLNVTVSYFCFTFSCWPIMCITIATFSSWWIVIVTKRAKKRKPLLCLVAEEATRPSFSHFQKPFLYQSIFIFTSLMPQAIILLSTLPYLYTQFWDSHSLLGSFLFFSFLILPYLGHPFFGFLSIKETCDKSLLQGFCFYTPRVSVDCLKSVGHSLMKEKLDSSSLKRSLWVDQTW